MNPTEVSKARLRRMAGRWHDDTTGGKTFALRPGEPPPREITLGDDAQRLIESSDTGAFLLWSQAQVHLVLPPFPIAASVALAGWHTGPLQSLLDKPRRIAVLLLRLGGYAVGVFEGEILVSSKVGSPFVKGRHKKGGSSSSRFARRRGEQARSLFDKACAMFQEQVEPYQTSVDHLLLGGDRLTILSFEKRCPYLSRFKTRRLQRILDVPDPRLRVLQGLPRLMYMSRVVSFTPPMPNQTAQLERSSG